MKEEVRWQMGRLFEVLCEAMGCAVNLWLCGETRGRKIHHRGTESTEALICTLITISFTLSPLCFHLPSYLFHLPFFSHLTSRASIRLSDSLPKVANPQKMLPSNPNLPPFRIFL
jgi:hypothetical protein